MQWLYKNTKAHLDQGTPGLASYYWETTDTKNTKVSVKTAVMRWWM